MHAHIHICRVKRSCRGHNDLLQPRDVFVVARLDKQEADMKMKVIEHYTLFSRLLVMICFSRCYHTTLGSQLAVMVTCFPQNLKIAFIEQSPPRYIAVHGDEERRCWAESKE